MNPHQETIETWNSIASLYQEKFMELNLYNHTYDLFCSFQENESGALLDIGCGPGNISKYILGKKPALRITGIDLAPAMIELAGKNVPEARFKVHDCRQINTLNLNFDAISCGFCLPYLNQTECIKLITDCSNMLYKNGILYLSFVDGDPERSGFKTGSSGLRVFFYYHTVHNIRNMLLADNFDILSESALGYTNGDGSIEPHIVFIAKKK